MLKVWTMSFEYDIILTVKEVKGHCDAGHKVGDTIEWRGSGMKGHICPDLLHTLYPLAFAMKLGANLAFLRDKDRFDQRCPDPKNRVVIEVRRVKPAPSE